jgi:hypothetical protein
VSTYNILADDVEEVLFMREFDRKIWKEDTKMTDYADVKINVPVEELSPLDRAKVVMRRLAEQIVGVRLIR